MRDRFRVSPHLRAGHGKEGIGAVYKRSARAERNKRIHVRRAAPQALESADKEVLIDDHDRGRKQQLRKAHRDVVPRKECRQRPAPHHVSHGNIHEREQESDRQKQSAFETRRIVILERRLRLALRLRGDAPALFACTVPRTFHRGNHGIGSGVAFHAHRVCQQTHGAGRNARHSRNRLFDPCRAGGAAHAGHIVLFLHITRTPCGQHTALFHKLL